MSGTVRVGTASNIFPLPWVDIDTAIAASWTCIRWDRFARTQRLYLFTEESSEVRYRTSPDEGATWSAMAVIAAGKKPAVVITRDNFRFIYWIDGAAIKGQLRDADDVIIEATFTVVASGVDDQGLAVDETWLHDNKRKIVLLYVAGGNLNTVSSVDGKNFS